MNKLVYLLFFLATFAVAQTPMDANGAMELKNQATTLSASVNSISSDFVQYKHLDFLDNDIKTSGKLHFKAPNLVKWAYVDPFKYSILFKDKKLFIDNEGNKSKVSIGSSKVFEQLNELIISSVKGDMFDDEKFTIAYFKENKKRQAHFTPKDADMAKLFKKFILTFDAKGDVVQVKMIEPSGDYTTVDFINKTLNQPINGAVFTP